MTESSAIDRLVVARGAASGLLVAVPAAFANSVLAAQDEPSPLLGLVTLVVLVAGFLLAGFVAGLEAPADGVRHGMLAAAIALVPVELIAILGRLDRDAGVSPLSILIVGFLAIAAGRYGATLGQRRRARKEAS